MNNIGSRIKQIRKQAGLNQTDFGNAVHVSAAHISGIEKGKEKPSDRLINLIAIKFNVNEEWIKFGTGPMGPNFTQAALKTLRNNRENNDIYPEITVSMNSYYAKRYMEIVEAFRPSGAIPDFIPFMHSQELISIFNYLQYIYMKADEREQIKIEVRFEMAFPDYKAVIKKITEEYTEIKKMSITMNQGTGKTLHAPKTKAESNDKKESTKDSSNLKDNKPDNIMPDKGRQPRPNAITIPEVINTEDSFRRGKRDL